MTCNRIQPKEKFTNGDQESRRHEQRRTAQIQTKTHTHNKTAVPHITENRRHVKMGEEKRARVFRLVTNRIQPCSVARRHNSLV